MHVAIMSHNSMSRKHGTGVQLIRTFDDPGVPYTHFYLTSDYAGASEVKRSHRLEEVWPKWLKGKRSFAKMVKPLGFHPLWWYNDQINGRKFDRLISKCQIQPSVFYALVGTEQHARRAMSLISHFQCPYVVHIMDLYEPQGITPEEMPGMVALLEGAASVLVLTETIRDEVLKIRDFNVESVPIGIPRTQLKTTPPQNDKIRIFMMGRVYEGVELLAEAYEKIMLRWPNAQVVYAGNHLARIPEPFRSRIDYKGYISSHEQLQNVLNSCHVAFLCGPYHLDGFGKFSFPSRVSDYLMGGLPIVSAAGRGTAARRMLEPLETTCVRTVSTSAEIPAALDALTSTGAWLSASAAARYYAESNFLIDEIRTKILASLRAASRPVSTVPSPLAPAV